jgi:hypothetical protein
MVAATLAAALRKIVQTELLRYNRLGFVSFGRVDLVQRRAFTEKMLLETWAKRLDDSLVVYFPFFFGNRRVVRCQETKSDNQLVLTRVHNANAKRRVIRTTIARHISFPTLQLVSLATTLSAIKSSSRHKCAKDENIHSNPGPLTFSAWVQLQLSSRGEFRRPRGQNAWEA